MTNKTSQSQHAALAVFLTPLGVLLLIVNVCFSFPHFRSNPQLLLVSFLAGCLGLLMLVLGAFFAAWEGYVHTRFQLYKKVTAPTPLLTWVIFLVKALFFIAIVYSYQSKAVLPYLVY